MSEQRVPDYSILVRLPKKPGNKTCKIELFRIAQFRTSWSHAKRKKFYPPVPLKFNYANEYWSKELYRVRIDGKWITALIFEKKYTFFDWSEIMYLVRNV